jgi:hypothetical protein
MHTGLYDVAFETSQVPSASVISFTLGLLEIAPRVSDVFHSFPSIKFSI